MSSYRTYHYISLFNKSKILKIFDKISSFLNRSAILIFWCYPIHSKRLTGGFIAHYHFCQLSFLILTSLRSLIFQIRIITIVTECIFNLLQVNILNSLNYIILNTFQRRNYYHIKQY